MSFLDLSGTDFVYKVFRILDGILVIANAKNVVAKLPEIYGKMAKNESALASK